MSEWILHGAALALLPLGAWHLARLARRLPPPPAAPEPGVGDAIAGSVLAAWFVALIAQSRDEPQMVNASAVAGSAIIYGLLVALVGGFLAVRGVPAGVFLGLRPWPPWKSLLPFSVVGLAAALPLIYVAQWIASAAFGAEPPKQPILEYWMRDAGVGGRALVVLMAVVIAPLAEEILFRGYLFRVAEQYAGTWPAMATTSLLFAAVHVHLPAFGGLVILAMALNILYRASGSLWAPIAAHSLFNALTLAASLAWPQSF